MTASMYRRHVLPTQIFDPYIHQWDPLTTPRLTSREAALLRRVPGVPKAIWPEVVPSPRCTVRQLGSERLLSEGPHEGQ